MPSSTSVLSPCDDTCFRCSGSTGIPRRGFIICCIGLGWLAQLGTSDTYDIGVKLYSDENCLITADQFLLLDNGCYANIWEPNATKGFMMTITQFDAPQRYSLKEYADDCHTLHSERQVFAGTDRCNPFMGSVYATFDIRFRSATCNGQLCSQLSVAVQTFYEAAGCSGAAYAVFKYPIQGECLRAINGTQAITASSDDSNITLVDYVGNDRCGASGSVATRRTYAINNAFCYPLYTTNAPMSFEWVVERYVPFVVSFSHRSSIASLSVIFASYLFLGLAKELPGSR